MHPQGTTTMTHGRPSSRVGAALLALICHFSLPAAAQQVDVGAIQKKFQELYQAGNLAGALAEARKMEAAVKARVGPSRH